MSDSRINLYEKPDYMIDYDQYSALSQAKNRLIELCKDYIRTHSGFFNQNLLAQHVIKELNFLDSRDEVIPAKHMFSFKQVVLKSYLIALQECLPKSIKFSDEIDQLVNVFFPNQNFNDVKQSYQNEIDQIKGYFSSFIFRQCAYEYNQSGGISVFYAAYCRNHSEIQTHPKNGFDLKSI